MVQRRPSVSERFKLFLRGASVPDRYVDSLAIISASIIHSAGVESYVRFMKAHKMAYLLMVQGKPWNYISEIRPYLVPSRRGTLRLKYVILQDFLLVYGTSTPEAVSHVRAFFDLIYTLIPTKVTNSDFLDWKKYLDMEKSYIEEPDWSTLENLITRFSRLIGKQDLEFHEEIWSFLKVGTKSTKNSPYYSPSQNKMVSQRRSEISTYDFLDLWTRHPELHRLWRTYPEKVSPQLLGSNDIDVPFFRGGLDTVPIGTISCIKEQGYKFRWIANPHISVQMVSEPLKKALHSLSCKVPWIYTFDQELGRFSLQKLMKRGLTVSCFDASKFTDTFSRSFQKLVLKNLVDEGSSEWACDLISLFSKSKWQYSNNEKLQLVSWKSGQPLGTGPSFHLACLSHAVVLWMSCVIAQSGHKTIKSFFLSNDRFNDKWDRVAFEIASSSTGCVGDDSFIGCSDSAVIYKELMELLGVEINLSKSVSSDVIAEFCGKWVFRGHLIKSSKPHGSYQHYDQIISDIKRYGIHYANLIPNSLLKRFNLLGKLLTPEWAGGIGLDREGLPEFDSCKYLDDRSVYTMLGFFQMDPTFCEGESISAEQIRITRDLLRKRRIILEDMYSVYNEYYSRNNPYSYDIGVKTEFVFDWSTVHGKRINEMTMLPINKAYTCRSVDASPARQPSYTNVTDIAIWNMLDTSIEQITPNTLNLEFELNQIKARILGGPYLPFQKFTATDRFTQIIRGIQSNVNETRKQKHSNPGITKSQPVPSSRYIKTKASDYNRFFNIGSQREVESAK